MVLPNSAARRSFPEDQFERRKFTRRTDLTSQIRLAIAADALHAMVNGVWGAITNLADHYRISRPFVYSLADTLKEVGEFLFAEAAESVPASSSRGQSIQMMLLLRLEAQSGIGAISTIMNRLGLETSSMGSISQILSRIGGLLSNTLSMETGTTNILYS